MPIKRNPFAKLRRGRAAPTPADEAPSSDVHSDEPPTSGTGSAGPRPAEAPSSEAETQQLDTAEPVAAKPTAGTFEDWLRGDDPGDAAVEDDAAPRPRRISATTTRRVLGVVAVGAVVAAFVTIFLTGGFSKDDDLETHSPKQAAATGAAAGEAFGTAHQGDCLTWTKPDASDLKKVDCGSEHLFEVAAEVDLSKYPGAEFAPGSKFPGVLRFAELKDQHCVPAVQNYLGARFDPHGKFSVGLINPGEAGWSNGERTLRCGLQYSGNSGALRPIVGKVAEQDQSDVLPPGTCVGINQNLPADPVDCAQPHAFETVGVVDLSAAFPGGPPSVDDQDRFIEPACTKAANDYLGSPDALRNKTLTLFWGQFDSTSWLAGSRNVNCSVGKGAEVGFAPIQGSAKGDILIDGQPPVPPPAVPEGRSVPAPLPGAAPAPLPPG